MKAADLSRAQTITAGLHKVSEQRKALALGATGGGIRCRDTSGTWIDLPSDDLVPVARRALDRKEAELRRSAAQIGLVL